MPVFLQLRLWLREGPVRERVLAGTSMAIVLVLLFFATMPLAADGPGSDGSATALPGAVTTSPLASNGQQATPGGAATEQPATGAGATGATAAGGPESGTAGGSAAGQAPAAGSAPAASGGCSGLTASAPGVTAEELRIAVSLVNLAGPVGNAAFNLRPDLHDIVDAVVDDINKNGGVACGRKLVVKKYDVNPIDQNDQQSKCLQMVQDKPFGVVDVAGYARAIGRACFVQNRLPFQLVTVGTEAEIKKGYPFIYGAPPTGERAVRNGVLGLADVGYFAAPKFKKLGLLADGCDPPVTAEVEATLAKVGVQRNQISTFTLGCQLVAPPSEVAQAVVQHKAAGATHVFFASSLSNGQRYVQFAKQQDFRPSYGMSDYGTYHSASASWDSSFDGATVITTTHSGELDSGIRSPQVVACDRVLRAHGLKGVVTEKDDGVAQTVCDQLSFFRQAIEKAGPNPTRQSFIEGGVSHLGLFKGGIIADGVFDRPGKIVGGDFRRRLRFVADCPCWKVQEPNFGRGS